MRCDRIRDSSEYGPDARFARGRSSVPPGACRRRSSMGAAMSGRRATRERLRKPEELHRAVILALPEAVTATDLQGFVTYVSSRTLALHGFGAPEEMVG